MSNVSAWKRHQVVYEVRNHGDVGSTGGVIRDLYDLIRSAERHAKENGIDSSCDDYATWEADEESLRVVFQMTNGSVQLGHIEATA
jgi:hypothetical protein